MSLGACTSEPSEDPQECSNMIWDVPSCDDCDGYFGLYGVDLFANDSSYNRASGMIHLGENYFRDIDGGSWFVNSFEFEKKVNGYGNAGYSGLHGSEIDNYWGKSVQIRLNGKVESGIQSVEGQLRLPEKLSVNFDINGQKPSIQDIEMPILIKRGDNINLTWHSDESYNGDILVSINFNKPKGYSCKKNNDFKDYNLGNTWTPMGEMIRIVRATCHIDNGNFTISPSWHDDIEKGEVIWVHISRRSSNIITNNENNYIVFSDYDVVRSFKIE